jgi:preprotein translocase subunit SecY
MQLLSVSPQLEALKKEGRHRRKITQYTRYGTVVLATFQALALLALESQPAWCWIRFAFRSTTVSRW